MDAVYREHFIVAFAPGEALSSNGWTDHEREQVLETKWWSLDELRASSEAINPAGLAELLEPVLRGRYPEKLLILP